MAFPEAAKDVVDSFAPKFPLHISWGAATVAEGATLTPSDCKDTPAVCFDGEPGKLYTIVLADPDAPNPTDPKFACWVHWLHINAPASDIKSGDSIVKYFGSAPGQGAGVHRYCFVVYEQTTGAIAPEEPRIPLKSGFPPRRSFNPKAFAAANGLVPVGVLTYRAEWDASVPELVKLITPDTC